MSAKLSLDDFKLSCELLGHSMDVRAVTEGDKTEQTILSGSRDKTVKIWRRDGNGYVEDITLNNHTNFVSCVFYLTAEKWICTGSNDSTICIYRENSIVPFMTLKGHKGTVCAIAGGIQSKSILTGSWDTTARIWKIDEEGLSSSFIELKGHEAAVWAVATLSSEKYVTGSADKMICYWNGKGEKLRMLKGHTDCVRGLVGLPDGSLLSCANDAVIRLWNEDGETVRDFCGHNNYIYSIALNKALGEDVFVTGGEDSTFRLWSTTSGNLGGPMYVPAQSVWSVTSLSNGDIVVGSSDGVVRVFTKDPSRFAKQTILECYKAAIETRISEALTEFGGIKKTDLPGPESLLTPGRDGQTKMVRQPNGKVECYQWSNNKWEMVGEVMGASGGSQKTSGKTLHEGKEYDYVFSVDISDTEPPIKLPYNLGEDPWQAAQKFIHKNNLPQVYLEQVANFVIKNSKSDGTVIQQTASGFEDPFTGGTRYVPGSTTTNAVSGGNADPFTGGSSYSTGGSQVQVNFANGSAKHFPVSTIVTFDNCDASKVLQKMREFNNKVGDNNLSVSDDVLQLVVKLSHSQPEINKTAIETFEHLLKWPKDILFPVLDIARLAIRSEQIYVLLTTSSNFLDVLLPNLSGSVANQLMTIRCLANMMRHESGRQQIEMRLEAIIDVIKCINTGSANLQIAIATFYLNATISQTSGRANGEKCRIITDGLIELLKWAIDFEAAYRAIQAIGNLSCTPIGSECTAQVISVDFVMDKIREWSDAVLPSGYEKLNEAVKALLAAF